MPPAGSTGPLSLLWKSLAALIAAVGVSAAIRYFLRKAAAVKRLTDASKKKIQHTVQFVMPDLAEDSETNKKISAIVAKMNELPGVQVCFNRFGSKGLGKEAFLQEMGKPDMSQGFTHCLFMVADGIEELKGYLHSALHKEDWMKTVGPFVKFNLVTDTEFGISLPGSGATDPILQTVMLRFQGNVSRGSDLENSLKQVVGEFSKCPGISATLSPMGVGDMTKDELLQAVNWPDKTFGISHMLTIAADSPSALKNLMSDGIYKKWLESELPHLVQDGSPAVVLVFTPLTLTASN